jgi:tellurite resistance protein TerB
MKNNDAAARLIMRLIICIAGADGHFDDNEKRIARKIAMELGLNPADFELA